MEFTRFPSIRHLHSALKYAPWLPASATSSRCKGIRS